MDSYDPDVHMVDDHSETSSDATYGTENFIEAKGSTLVSESVSSTHNYDRFFRQNFEIEIEWEDFNLLTC